MMNRPHIVLAAVLLATPLVASPAMAEPDLAIDHALDLYDDLLIDAIGPYSGDTIQFGPDRNRIDVEVRFNLDLRDPRTKEDLARLGSTFMGDVTNKKKVDAVTFAINSVTNYGIGAVEKEWGGDDRAPTKRALDTIVEAGGLAVSSLCQFCSSALSAGKFVMDRVEIDATRTTIPSGFADPLSPEVTAGIARSKATLVEKGSGDTPDKYDVGGSISIGRQGDEIHFSATGYYVK